MNYAIASRYHANILWHKLNIPTIPISYSPKVQSFYEESGGKSYNAKDLYNCTNLVEIFQNIPLFCLPKECVL